MSFTVTFDENTTAGGTGVPAPQVESAPTALTTNATGSWWPAGYNFIGWNTAIDGSGEWFYNEEVYSFSADITLYAQYAAFGNGAVFFEGNGSDGGTMAQVEIAAYDASLTVNGFTKTGYVFAGWATNPNGTGTTFADGASFPFNGDLGNGPALYAQWTVDTFTVTYEGNGAFGSMATQSSATAAQLDTCQFSSPGQVFVGWCVSADGVGETFAPNATYAFTENLTLFAQWSDGSINRFVAGGSTLDDTGSVSGTAKACLATQPPQLAKIVVVALQNWQDAGGAISLPIGFSVASVITDAAWATAALAAPTVAATQLTLPAVASPVTSVITVIGV